jgi:DNA-binding IclR family transcriptional regulator
MLMDEAARSKRGRQRGAGTQTVQSAARAVRIMRSLFLAPAGKHLTEISEEMGLHKTTTLRLLRTLVAEGMVQCDRRDAHYRIHPLAWLAVVTSLPAVSLSEAVRGTLEALAESTGATAMILAPRVSRRSMIATAWAMPNRPLRVNPSAVDHAPMHACAAGKCYLASLSDSDLHKWLNHPLAQITPDTTTLASKLLKQILLARKRGYVADRGEFLSGAGAVAVPVTGQDHNLLGVLCLAAPAGAITPANTARWLPLMRSASSQLSQTFAALGGAVDGQEPPLPSQS